MVKDIPENLYELFDILGEEKALEVLKRYQGTTVYFSKAILKQLEREEMRQEYSAGKTIEELSKIYHYSKSYIRFIIKKA